MGKGGLNGWGGSNLSESRGSSAAALPIGPIYHLAPELNHRASGIAHHARLVHRALAERGEAVTTIALLDQPGHPAGDQSIACGGSRVRFIAHTLAAALRRPELILVEHLALAPLGWIAARLAGARLVVFLHGIEAWKPAGRLERWALHRADCLLAVSRTTARRAAAAANAPSDRTHVLHNCLDPDFAVTDAPRRQSTSLSLLTVSRIRASESYKGHDLVIHVLPHLLPDFPDLCYDIVGDGDGRPSLERLVADLGLQSRVHFHGEVPDSALEEFYRNASLFVMPSAGEGFGYVFLEAMASGLPVVAAHSDATGEVVRDGVTGVLVERDEEHLLSALSALLGDSERLRRMSLAAREHVASSFGFADFQAALLSHLGPEPPEQPGHH